MYLIDIIIFIGHTFCAHSGIGYLFGGVANENDDPRYNLPRWINLLSFELLCIDLQLFDRLYYN